MVQDFWLEGSGAKYKSQVLDGARQIEIHDARLNDGAQIRGVNFQNPVHARKDDYNAATAGDGSAGKPGARAASHNRSFIAIGEANNFGHVLRGVGKNDDSGANPAPPTRHTHTASNLRVKTGPPRFQAGLRVRG